MSKKQKLASFFSGLAIILFVISIFIPDNGTNDNGGMIGGITQGFAFISMCVGFYLIDSAKKDKKKLEQTTNISVDANNKIK